MPSTRAALSRRDFVRTGCIAAAGLPLLRGLPGLAFSLPPEESGRKSDAWPFYAFDNGLQTVPGIEDKVKLLKDLGYVGLEYHLNHAELPRMLEALEKHGLELHAVYTVPWLEDPVDPKLEDSIRRMKGHPTRIECAIRSRKLKTPSDPAGDPQALELLERISDFCGDLGPVVSVYPHTWFWTEKVDDGVRLAKKSGRKNIGSNFNLVHWYWVKQSRSLEETLRASLPHLFTVTINNGKKSGREIWSLERGDYELLGVLKILKKLEYEGPVGLQCYSVPGSSEEHLRRSMEAWRKLLAELADAAPAKAEQEPRPSS
jgi:sugar phosphate isomerase/epimerase